MSQLTLSEVYPAGAAPSPDPARLVHDLRERVKELTLLHEAARVLDDETRPMPDVLADLVAILPPAWQYPEIAAASVTVGELEVATPDFTTAVAVQRAEFAAASTESVVIRIAYLEERPFEWEGPFLLEERRLIDSVARMIAAALARRFAWREVNRINAELEERVASRTAALEGVTRALETFAYSVAHDLKAPLRGIDGYSRLLLEDYLDRLDAEGRAFLFNIRDAADRMSQLIDDLLAYSMVDRRPLTTGPVSIRAVVASVVTERQHDLNRERIDLVESIRHDTVLADVEALEQVVRNYLDNAIKFARGVAAPRIEIGAEAHEGRRRLWVRDNGIGFDMKYHDRIFEIFQRLHRQEEHPGTGVGLAIVRKAMERMGGTAWAESSPGHGATFFIEIPGAED